MNVSLALYSEGGEGVEMSEEGGGHWLLLYGQT